MHPKTQSPPTATFKCTCIATLPHICTCEQTHRHVRAHTLYACGKIYSLGQHSHFLLVQKQCCWLTTGGKLGLPCPQGGDLLLCAFPPSCCGWRITTKEVTHSLQRTHPHRPLAMPFLSPSPGDLSPHVCFPEISASVPSPAQPGWNSLFYTPGWQPCTGSWAGGACRASLLALWVPRT